MTRTDVRFRLAVREDVAALLGLLPQITRRLEFGLPRLALGRTAACRRVRRVLFAGPWLEYIGNGADHPEGSVLYRGADPQARFDGVVADFGDSIPGRAMGTPCAPYLRDVHATLSCHRGSGEIRGNRG